MREACREVATADLDYGDPRGSAALREVLAGYLRRVRAAAAGPEDLVVCTGFAQGLNLVLQVLSQLGVGRVAFEDPGYGDDETSTSVRSAAWRARRRSGCRSTTSGSTWPRWRPAAPAPWW